MGSPSRAQKRSRSPSGSRSRSSSPPPPPPEAPRAGSEWVSLHSNAVLCLPPTPDMVKASVFASKGVDRKKGDGVAVAKVAAFDMDDTIIMPSTGKVFPKDDPADWKWTHSNVPKYLRLLHKNGFMVTLLSNQSGIGKGDKWNTAKANAVKEKIIRLSTELKMPLAVFIATRDDEWRKPNTSMWGLIQHYIEEGVKPLPRGVTVLDCHSHSFYVGDAAGRHIKTLAGRAKDFSCSDRAFAYNVCLPFLTPEEFFLAPEASLLSSSSSNTSLSAELINSTGASTVPFEWGNVTPDELKGLPTSYAHLTLRTITSNAVGEVQTGEVPMFARKDTPEVVLFVGYPGCGKSTFYTRYFAPFGYAHANRDTLKTKEKCVALVEQCLKAGRSVVVDNTNPTAADRLPFVKAAAAAKPPVPVRICIFTHTMGMATHMNAVRGRLGISARIPTIAYRMYHSKFEAVNTPAAVKKEGVESVLEIPPVAQFEGLPPAVRREFFKLS